MPLLIWQTVERVFHTMSSGGYHDVVVMFSRKARRDVVHQRQGL